MPRGQPYARALKEGEIHDSSEHRTSKGSSAVGFSSDQTLGLKVVSFVQPGWAFFKEFKPAVSLSVDALDKHNSLTIAIDCFN